MESLFVYGRCLFICHAIRVSVGIEFQKKNWVVGLWRRRIYNAKIRGATEWLLYMLWLPTAKKVTCPGETLNGDTAVLLVLQKRMLDYDIEFIGGIKHILVCRDFLCQIKGVSTGLIYSLCLLVACRKWYAQLLPREAG